MGSQCLKAVHLGAGNIGRGFVACSFHKSGYEVVFGDVNEKTTERLNAQKSYKVIEVGVEGTEESTITNYRAINSKTNEVALVQEIATAEIVTCSVGPHILKFVAPVVAKGIMARSYDLKPLAVIACENAINATNTLAEHVRAFGAKVASKVAAGGTPTDFTSGRAVFANCAIDRIVPAQDPDAGLDVKLEKWFEWVIESGPFDKVPGGVPDIHGVKWVRNLEPYIERKLYTVNTGHATAAYHGYHRRRRTIADAMQDRFIAEQVRRTLNNTSWVMVEKHGFDRADQLEYAQTIIERMENPHLEDSVERVGRAPLRKLSRSERFVGPAALLAEQGRDCSSLLDAAEMAFRFQDVEEDAESKELAAIMAGKQPEEVVREVCGLEDEHKLFPMIVEVVSRVQRTQSDSDSQDE